MGIERFVVDDGWFGRRQDITSSLGDWTPNEAKLGGSLASLIEAIKTLGLDFGLWVEPEMVSPDSELFSEHPDWIIADPHHRPQTPRCQYVLDLGRREVQDYLITTLTKLLADNDIAYLKWDMNRNLTDTYSVGLSADHQGECRHRYILGLYRVLTVLRQTFPQVMIEGCAGGGGRFDAGMLAFAPQIWASDDTDAIARLAVQHGTSMIYPPACISCHVSAVPNHQLKRVTPLETRTIVAEFGTLGYELDLSKCSEQEREQLATSISTYKKYRKTLQFGRLDWLSVHDRHNEYAWEKLTDTTLIIDHVNVLVQPNTVMKRLRAQNLPPEAQYTLQGDDKHYSAAYLMAVGIVIPQPAKDFDSHQWIFKRIGGDAV